MRRAFPLLALLVAGCVGSPIDPAAVAIDAPLPGLGTLAAAVLGTGADAFEPTLGVDADGALYYAAVAAGVAIGAEPLVLKSVDGGATWADVSPRVAGTVALPPETNDPFVYVDPETGRVFQFAMAPILVCAVLSWSDDGGDSWITNPRGCGNIPLWDHQSMVAAHSRGTPTTPLYPNVVHQCVNNDGFSWCSRSLDGGFSWTMGTPAFNDGCGGLHGHPVAHPDGTVFLPKMACGSASVAYTEDDGLTWTPLTVSEVPGHPWPDPAMAVDAAGNVYYAYVGETGDLLLSVSADVGRTWSEPIVANPPGVTTHIPALAAGDDGMVVLAYPGTADLPKGYDSTDEEQDAASWHAYLTIVSAATSGNATFEHVRATPQDDPLVRGRCGPERCPGMTDFIDVVVGPDGRPYAAFVDSCSATCAAAAKVENDQGEGILVTLSEGTRLRAS